MTELFEEIILVGGYDPNKFVARIDELKELGWFVDHTLKVEFTDDDTRVRVAKLKRPASKEFNPKREYPFVRMLTESTKEQLETALIEYNGWQRAYAEWQSMPVFSIGGKKAVMEYIYQATQEHLQHESLIMSIVAVSNLDQQQFLKDFELWYQSLEKARSRIDCLEYIYQELVMGHGLPWEKAND